MKRASRNDPCPCGSGRKYKKCHLVEDEGLVERSARPILDNQLAPKAAWGLVAPSAIPDTVRTAMRAALEKRKREETQFGKVRPIVSTLFDGNRIVGVGSVVHWSDKWKTFTDFLLYYIKHVLGAEWGNTELAKPEEERHPVIQWFRHAGRFMDNQAPNEKGLKEALPDGVTLAYLAMAYDLYVVGHHVQLQERLVSRLRHRDQFQGARYELAVLATLVRAGFDVEFEDETDTTRRHAEYLAVHRDTGFRISVEAKSRHRPGVLGFAQDKSPHAKRKLGLGRLLRAALGKNPVDPFVIFIDANFPLDAAQAQVDGWLKEVGDTAMRLGHGISRDGVVEGAPFNALFVTNFAHYYGEFGQDYPEPFGSIHVPNFSRRLGVPKALIDAIEIALTQYGRIPNWSDETLGV